MISVEEQYWDKRYRNGGMSSARSIGDYSEFKWSVIDKHIPFFQSVVDVGCGDLSFWEGRDCKDYTGIDVSKIIIDKNKILRPDWNFICSNAETRIYDLNKNVVFCLSVLFDIMYRETYLQILKNLCIYSKDYIFIYTWINNPFRKERMIKRIFYSLFKLKVVRVLDLFKRVLLKNNVTDNEYQYYRPLENDFGIFFKKGFDLIEIVRHPDSIGAMYVFKKQ